MARPNGNHAATRKKLVQPVLPALPLIPKVKKESGRVKELEQTQANGVAPATPAAVKSEKLDVQTILPVASEAIDSQQTGSPKKLTADAAFPAAIVDVQSIRASQEPSTLQLSDAAPDPTEEKADLDTTEQNISVPSTIMVNAEVALNAPDTPSSIKRSADTLTHSSGSAAIPHEDQSYGAETEEADPAIDDTESHDPEIAPGAVIGQVGPAVSTQHSNHPSVSSSIQHTPKYTIKSPNFADNPTSNQNLSLSNGGDRSALHGVPNGQSSAVDQTVPANGAPFPTSGSVNFPTIPLHVRNLQYYPEWLDCELCVYFTHSSKPAFYRGAHSLILIRSDRLRSFIYPQRANSFTYYVVNLAPARPISPDAFDAALKFLYEDTVLSAERVLLPYTGLDKSGRVRAFDYVVSYMISGLELGLEPVTTRALDLIGRLLDWDLAELAVKEAIVLRSSSAPAINPHAPRDAMFAAKAVIQHVFNLIVLRLDVRHFKLDSVITATDLAPRFADVEAGRSAFNPALANMVFGSMPASGNLSPISPHETFSSPVVVSPDTIASVVMLNVDFEDLVLLVIRMKKIHGDDGLHVMSEVVEERERRRIHVLNNRSIPNKQRTANSATWDIVGRREFISDGSLQQEHTGFLLPSKRSSNN